LRLPRAEEIVAENADDAGDADRAPTDLTNEV
jgi:hypothetical protein